MRNQRKQEGEEEVVANICSACFSKLGAETERLECEFCHDPDVRYCSKQCRSALGWSQHQDVCNVVHSTELVAVPYAWQTMTNDWHEQRHKFPAYIVRQQLAPTQIQQTMVPAITQGSSGAPGAASAAPENKTKAHSFHVEVNGVQLGARLQAPNAMISEYSGNAAAQQLASLRIPRTEGRTYWVSNKHIGSALSTAASGGAVGAAGAAGAAGVQLNVGGINEFRLVRGAGETQDVRKVRVHLVGAPVAHFEEQVKNRLGTGLRRFLKEQYKYKGLSGPADVAATYYGVNPETRDTVTFSINKELQLVDLEFYAPKVQEPVSLRRQTYETAFDDQDPHCVQALIMALSKSDADIDAEEQHLRVLEEHHRRLTNPSVNIEGDISHLIRVRSAVSASLDLLQAQQQQLIGDAARILQWSSDLEKDNAQDIKSTIILRWAEKMKQLRVDLLKWKGEKGGSSDMTGGRSLGFRRRKAAVRQSATQKSINALEEEIQDFITAIANKKQYLKKVGCIAPENLRELQYLEDLAMQVKSGNFVNFPEVQEMEVRATKGTREARTKRVKGELRYFQEAPRNTRKPIGTPLDTIRGAAAVPIGGWVMDDAYNVIWEPNLPKANKNAFDRYWEAKTDVERGSVLTTEQAKRGAEGIEGKTDEQLFWVKRDGNYVRKSADGKSLVTVPIEETDPEGEQDLPPDDPVYKAEVLNEDNEDEEEEDYVVPSVPPDHPAGKRNYFYGGAAEEDDDLVGVTLEELIACSFPESIMLHPNFDWRTTPAVLSEYPEHVEALRGQALIGARSEWETAKMNEVKALKKILSENNKKLREVQKQLRLYREGKRVEERGDRQIKRGGARKGRGQKKQAQAMQTKNMIGEEFIQAEAPSEFTVEELIACSFPREIMLNPNFNWRETPAVLSEYPEHVEALRAALQQANIGDDVYDGIKKNFKQEADSYKAMEVAYEDLKKKMTYTKKRRDYFWKSLLDYKKRNPEKVKEPGRRDSMYHSMLDGGQCSCSDSDEEEEERRVYRK